MVSRKVESERKKRVVVSKGSRVTKEIDKISSGQVVLNPVVGRCLTWGGTSSI